MHVCLKILTHLKKYNIKNFKEKFYLKVLFLELLLFDEFI